MKTAEQLKKELHEYIDSIDNKETLKMVHEDVSAYLKKDTSNENDEDNELTEEQERELDEAIRQADAGKTIGFDEFKRKMSGWHTK
jgi:hypothetical protein